MLINYMICAKIKAKKGNSLILIARCEFVPGVGSRGSGFASSGEFEPAVKNF